MSPDETPELPPRPLEVQSFTPIRMSATQKAALWSRLEALVAAAVPEAPRAPAGGAAVAAGASASKVAAIALAAGIALGAAIVRFGFPPDPVVKLVEVEKVVVRTQEVRVEVPVPAPSEQVAKPLARKPDPKPEQTAAKANVERQLLEGARTALVRRDAASALATLENLRRSFPRGQLVEERDSLQVQALQQARRDEDAKAAAKAFLERYPQSVFGPAVEAVLRHEK